MSCREHYKFLQGVQNYKNCLYILINSEVLRPTIYKSKTKQTLTYTDEFILRD